MVAGDRNDVFGEAVVDFLLRHVPVDGSAPDAPLHERQPVKGAHEITDVP